MDLITLDFETFYSREFGLSRMTTEEYIRDDRYHTIGVATKINDGETKWFPNHKNLIADHFASIDWDDALLIAHNSLFDAAILSFRYGVFPKLIADTLSMARAVDGPTFKHSLKAVAERNHVGIKGTEVVSAMGKMLNEFSPEELARYGEYCRNDVDLCFDIFKIYSKHFTSEELEVISTTIKMFTEPILELDIPLLEQHLESVREKKAELMAAANADSEVLQSNLKFAECLRTLGVTPPSKISPRTGKPTYAFAKSDPGMKELLEHPNIAVQTLTAARIGVKSTLEETRTERFLSIAKRAGVLPVPLSYYAAHTGRWGGSDKVNLQNLPSRGRENTLKKAIIAPKDHVIIDCDSSQIEARTLSWLSGQEDLTSAFSDGEDVYILMASRIYGKDPSDITKDERFVGKSTILGAGYGMGPERFRNQLMTFGATITLDEAKRIITTYRQTYPYIPALWREAQTALEGMYLGNTAPIGKHPEALYLDEKGFRLPNKMSLSYPELERDQDNQYSYRARNGRTRIYGGKVTENLCQALARCIIAHQMIRVGRRYKVALTVHDSLIIVVKEKEQEEAQEYIEEVMRTAPEWAEGLPLNCESGIGGSYGDCS